MPLKDHYRLSIETLAFRYSPGYIANKRVDKLSPWRAPIRAAAKSQKGPRKGTYPYRRYNKTQPALLCPLYEKIGCGEKKLV